jgi:hypothetical protein
MDTRSKIYTLPGLNSAYRIINLYKQYITHNLGLKLLYSRGTTNTYLNYVSSTRQAYPNNPDLHKPLANAHNYWNMYFD